MHIDAHQHFWKYDPVVHEWISDEISVLRADFLPAQLKSILDENEMDGSVLVQVDQSEEETLLLIDLAKENPFIKGVVGWVDLKADNLKERLDYFSGFKSLKGFRHILQSEQRDDFMLTDDFCRGIGLLHDYGFTYDILIYPRHLPYAIELVKRFPKQKFVIDHAAKPKIKEGLIREWEQNIRTLAVHENVYCKLSGLVTEAHFKKWQVGDMTPYIDVVVNAFGTDRIMYGSDWPVCLVAADYKRQLNIYQQYFAASSEGIRDNVFGNNAVRFYNL